MYKKSEGILTGVKIALEKQMKLFFPSWFRLCFYRHMPDFYLITDAISWFIWVISPIDLTI